VSLNSHSPAIRFGTDGWRGIIAKDFTFANVVRVTQAIVHYLDLTYPRNRPVLVAYDTRFLADQFAETAAGILSGSGWQVQLTDRDCPTPVIAYTARHRNTAGALMFTASHNPAPYCGIKYIPDYGGPAITTITDQIMANLAQAASASSAPSSIAPISTFDPSADYLQFLYSLLDVETIRRAHLKVKYDALYSTSRGYLDTALAHCGCQIQTLHAYRDVLFGGGLPEPRGQQLNRLVEAVRRDGADLGVATDGDGDRFGIVDEQGNILSANVVLLLLARHLLTHRGKTGAIVRTVATTHLLDRLAVQHGLDLYETPVGFKYIGEKMRQTQVLIGGEESGGLSILGHIPEKDGILAGLLVAEAIASAGKPLSQLTKEVLAETGGPLYQQRLDFPLDDRHQTHILESFITAPPKQLANIAVRRIGYQDGIKLYLADDSWVLLRPSGTEPLLRVQLESQTCQQSAAIAAEMKEWIEQRIL
jgi:phosphomannomutase